MTTRLPEWKRKHTCSTCGTGYGQCSDGWIHSLMCCKNCDHPTRREGYTDAEKLEMWEGHDNPPPWIIDLRRQKASHPMTTPTYDCLVCTPDWTCPDCTETTNLVEQVARLMHIDPHTCADAVRNHLGAPPKPAPAAGPTWVTDPDTTTPGRPTPTGPVHITANQDDQ